MNVFEFFVFFQNLRFCQKEQFDVAMASTTEDVLLENQMPQNQRPNEENNARDLKDSVRFGKDVELAHSQPSSAPASPSGDASYE